MLFEMMAIKCKASNGGFSCFIICVECTPVMNLLYVQGYICLVIFLGKYICIRFILNDNLSPSICTNVPFILSRSRTRTNILCTDLGLYLEILVQGLCRRTVSDISLVNEFYEHRIYPALQSQFILVCFFFRYSEYLLVAIMAWFEWTFFGNTQVTGLVIR